MAKRLDDEDRRPGDEREDEDRGWEPSHHPEVEAAEFEAERPARELSGLPKLVTSVAAVAVSLYALLWVVRPQPAQPYRTSFLAVTLAMTLLAYRPLARGRAASEEERAAGDDNPGPLDWALASLPLVATEVGRRTLVVGDRQVPLFASGGAPAHLVLTVRR